MEQISELFKVIGPRRTQTTYRQLASNPQAEEPMVPSPKRWEVLYHRLTYYWIAFVSLAFELLLEVIIICVLDKEGKAEDSNITLFFVSGFYSCLCLLAVAVLLWWQYKKQINTSPPSKVNALAHVVLCLTGVLCILPIFLFFALDTSKNGFPLGDIRSILVPLMGLLFVITIGALGIAARITYCAAASVRGTQAIPLVLPIPTAAAWTLATTSESQSIPIEQLRAKRLSGLLKGFPLFSSLSGTHRYDAYQQLPASSYDHTDSEVGDGEASRVEEKHYHRSTYYWIALASLSVNLLLGIIALSKFGGQGNSESADVGRFIVATFYSGITLVFLCILQWWQYKFQINTTPPSKVNALAHILLSTYASVMCLFAIFLVCVLGNAKGERTSEDTKNLIQLMILLLLVSVGTLCFASWITYRAAVRTRGTHQVPLSPLPTRTASAWTLATTSESQSILMVVNAPPI
ncbi:hypothetical protein GALMADRAFT_246768 [Galerina marginata CBS 339.88]|uniref:Uncharacterized protein n=1 Tax=Galerina marginata (strain CBS 339.88) TaxID=685588 RepID=A0A067T2B7_GALM3|nr:hypothetical protein GALMADRAFT_246768 [Galerina marginata CBS 339.88]